MLDSARTATFDVRTLPENLVSADAYLSGLYEEEANSVLTEMLGRSITATR
jgi:hypothetical protein